MSLVMVKDKFQVTIPARVRQELDVKVGDMLEAVVEGDRIVLRPKSIVDRSVVAARVHNALARADEPKDPAEEARVMDDVIAEIAAMRAERRRDNR